MIPPPGHTAGKRGCHTHPTAVDGNGRRGSASAIRPEDGEVLWRTDVRGWTWGTPLVVGDRIYAGMAGGRPYFCTHLAGVAVLDRASGRLLARRPLPEVPGAHQWGIAGSVALSGSTLVYATIEGGVYGLPVE